MSVMFDPDTAIYPFPPKPTPLSIDEKAYYREKIKRLLKERNAVMVAHYYTDPEIQQLAEETGGCISDSLEMAALRCKASRFYFVSRWGEIYGRNRQNSQSGKNNSDADTSG